MDKRLLVIGAGFLQSFIIKKAKEMGIYVLALDGDKDAEGFKYADEFEIIDITNFEKCLKYAQEKFIDGVMTGATDYGVITTSYIAEKLNLPGIEMNISKLVKDKYQISRVLNEINHNYFKQLYKIRDVKELDELQCKLSYPLIVKPIDGSGSKGVNKVNCLDELNKSVIDALNNSKLGVAMIQDYIMGKEYGADVFVYANKITVYGPIGKKMTSSPYYAELGHYYPTTLDEDKIINQIVFYIKKLNITFGAYNIDYIVDEYNNICIIDMGARLGGNLISSHIVPLAFNEDYLGNVIRISIGWEPIYSNKKSKYNVLSKVLALDEGKVISYDTQFKEDIYKNNVIFEDHINVGNCINKYRNNLDGMGYIILYSENSMERLDKESEEIIQKINHSIRRQI